MLDNFNQGPKYTSFFFFKHHCFLGFNSTQRSFLLSKCYSCMCHSQSPGDITEDLTITGFCSFSLNFQIFRLSELRMAEQAACGAWWRVLQALAVNCLTSPSPVAPVRCLFDAIQGSLILNRDLKKMQKLVNDKTLLCMSPTNRVLDAKPRDITPGIQEKS